MIINEDIHDWEDDSTGEIKRVNDDCDFIHIIENEEEDFITVTFESNNKKILKIWDTITDIESEAYMSGYNWEALFMYHFDNNYPWQFEELETDTDDENFIIHLEYSEENKVNAAEMAKIMEHLIENEDDIYDIVRENWDDIAWD